MKKPPLMKRTDVAKMVREIAKIAGDDESAHSSEDGMFIEVLRAIADGKCEDARACAAEALKSRDLDFARWCA